MRGMQKIYKRGMLEKDHAPAFVMFASLMATFATVLILLGMLSYWPIALLAAALCGALYTRAFTPYGAGAGSLRVAVLLIMNFSVLAVVALLF